MRHARHRHASGVNLDHGANGHHVNGDHGAGSRGALIGVVMTGHRLNGHRPTGHRPSEHRPSGVVGIASVVVVAPVKIGNMAAVKDVVVSVATGSEIVTSVMASVNLEEVPTAHPVRQLLR